MSPPRPLNVLILGYGFSAKTFHIPFVTRTAGLKLHSILQRTPSPSTTASAKTDYVGTDVIVFSSWKEVEGYQREAVAAGTSENEKVVGGVGKGKEKIDILVITAGNQVHGEFAKRGLGLLGDEEGRGKGGLHIVIEKPFTPTVKEAEEVIALAEKVGKVVTIYHNRRFDSEYLTLYKLLTTPDSPLLTNLTHLRSNYNRHLPPTPHRKPWKREVILGNGVLYDLGSHLIDQVLHLFRTIPALSPYGGERALPTRLLATLHDERGIYSPHSRERGGWGKTWVDDGFDLYLEYTPTLSSSQQDEQQQTEQQKKITIHLTATSASPFHPQERFLLRGLTTGYIKYGEDTQERQLISGTLLPGQPGFGEEPKEEWGESTSNGTVGGWEKKRVEPEKGDYGRYYQNLVEALGGTEGRGEGKAEVQVEVKPQDAVDVLRVIEAAGRSFREGRWVEI